MKVIKGLAIFFIMVCFVSCFDPPKFPSVPEIKFNDVEFIDDPSTAFDSLIVYIDFKDGDGDLGINPQDPDFISYPFHNSNFFQQNNGQLEPLHTFTASTNTDQFDILDIPDPSIGKLVSFRTRTDPLYSSKLPSAFQCSAYEALADRVEPNKPSTGRKLLIEKADVAVLDDVNRIVDTLRSETNEYYQLKDTLYYELNPDHYNIEVQFLMKDPSSTNEEHPGYTEFNWFTTFCQNFDGRFPYLTDNKNSLEGTLSYAMISTGFLVTFGSRPLKLRVLIRDRARNASNVVDSDEFTLDEIKKVRSKK